MDDDSRGRFVAGVERATPWVLAVLAGFASLWIVTEQDIYWQIRAGDEFLRTWHFPTVDTWSFSSPGAPWINVQWLSTVFIRIAYAIGEEPALIAFRGLLVAALFFLLATIVRDSAPSRRRWVVQTILLPLVFASIWFRLQLRSDLFVFIVFAALIKVWVGPFAPKTRRIFTPIMVALAANFHVGTAPFVLALALAFLLTDESTPRQKATWAAAATAAFFLNPYPIDALRFIWTHLFYYDYNQLPNPDHQPLRAHHLTPSKFGWAGIAWLTTCALGWVAFAAARWRKLAAPAFYARALVFVPLGAAITALCINRIRTFPYHVIFFLPILAVVMSHALALRLVRPATWALGAAVWLGLIPAHLNRTAHLWGFGVSDALFPRGSVRFVRETRPAKNLLHTFAYGAYTVWHLRDYPTYVDTRETLFWPLQREIVEAFYSPEKTRALIAKYGINTVLMPIPKTRFDPGVGFQDVLASYLPRETWALVHFDAISTVMVRRTAEHEVIISAHEYKILRPNLPPTNYLFSGARSPEKDRRFAEEIDRCRAREPDQPYCLIAQAALYRTLAADRTGEALALLERARAIVGPKAPLRVHLNVELMAVYRALGRKAEADAIEAAMGPGVEIKKPGSQPKR